GCSPLCKAKAESHGIDLPVYQGQKSFVEARVWRKTAWIGGSLCALALAVLGFWFWYGWFGSMPRTAFSVRFGEPAYSGQSALVAPDQIVFLHGATLARHDLKQKKEIWSRRLIDQPEIDAAVAR